MIDGLKKLLFGRNDAEEAVAAGAHADAALHHAAAGLLVEAALLDGDFSGEERQRIETLLRERFELGQSEIAELMIAAEEAAVDRVELHTTQSRPRSFFTRRTRKDDRNALGRRYADGDLDDFEANMMRAVTGLLYVSDRDSGDARKRVLARRSSST